MYPFILTNFISHAGCCSLGLCRNSLGGPLNINTLRLQNPCKADFFQALDS